MLPWWPDVTIVQSDVTIAVPCQLSTGSIQDYLFWYCPIVGILFEVQHVIQENQRMIYWNITGIADKVFDKDIQDLLFTNDIVLL